MPLTKLQFKPGINREITSYSNEGGWADCDKVRFRMGYPEKIGGWEKYSASTYQGTARRLHNWISLDGSDYLGLGTHLKYYIEEGEDFSDITPVRLTTSLGDVTFSATNGSTTVTVNETNHGASENDFVTFSGAATLGGLVTASILNAEHKIVSALNGNSYTITVSVTANSSDTGNGSFTDATCDYNNDPTITMDATGSLVASGTVSGTGIPAGATVSSITDSTTFELSASTTGGSVTNGTLTFNNSKAVYQINTGLDSQVGGTGWGSGLFGGTTAGALTTQLAEALDNSETAIDVDDETGITTAGDVILIEEELMLVAGDTDDNTLNVTRNHGGTTAVTHADNTIVRLATGNASSDDDFTGWGIAAVSATKTEIRTWSHDNFGEDLLINPRDGAVYYWDKTTGLDARAVELSTVSGAANAPTIAKQVLVSDQGHTFAFGSNTYGTTVQDPLLIRFSTYNDPLVWTVSSSTSAGFLSIGSGSKFVQAVETKREILVWTDRSLHTLRYIGDPLYYGLSQLSSNITIMGSKAAVATEDVVFWMGTDNFYVYAGGTQQLPCTVKDKVFLDFNDSQRDKVYAAINSEFSEVIWFYPSKSNSLANDGTGENDRYVIYNYGEKVWYFGSILRTAWIDRGTRFYPIAAGSSYLYNHEFGYNDDASAMTSYIESSPMDIGDGDKFTLIQKVIPDLTFDGSLTSSTPAATFTLKARNYPGESFDNTDTGTSTRTSTSPVEEYTKQLHLRARGRSFAMRVESSALSMKWKLGSPRVDIRLDGKR
mgnify:CR=1|tara:strand:+ start:2003 stop:4324 length:2322 start_codon:yes stop_codon:yes gene_type:complete